MMPKHCQKSHFYQTEMKPQRFLKHGPSILLTSDFTLTFFTSLVASQANTAPGTMKCLEFVPEAVPSTPSVLI